MAQVKPYERVVYFCAILARPDFPIELTEAPLEELFGEIDLRSETWPFTATDYYDSQMGEGLVRRFVSFRRLADPQELAGAKSATNELEEKLAGERGEAQPVNIDPGYLSAAQMVLASAKPFAHRVPLSGGIHAQLEYLFRHGEACFLEWTFPEYRRSEVVGFFLKLRERYRELLKAAATG